MKQVQKSTRTQKLYFTILQYLKDGKNLVQVCSKLGIKKQKLNYYIAKLKQGGFIKKIGYGTWEILKDLDTKQVQITPLVTTPQQGKSCTCFEPGKTRGHAFMFVLKIPELEKWGKRRLFLDKFGLDYTPLKNIGGGESLVLRSKKVHLKSRSIIIYDKASYVSDLARDSKSLAVYEFLSLVNHLENLLKVSFKVQGKYKFKVSREHYSLIKNCLARQYNNEGKKLFVSNDSGLWMLIDNSYNLHELETVKTDEAVPDSEGVRAYFNSHKETNFKVTPEFVLDTMNGIQQNQLIFADNMKSHVKAVQQLGNSTKALNEAVNGLREEVKKPKEKGVREQYKDYKDLSKRFSK